MALAATHNIAPKGDVKLAFGVDFGLPDGSRGFPTKWKTSPLVIKRCHWEGLFLPPKLIILKGIGAFPHNLITKFLYLFR